MTRSRRGARAPRRPAAPWPLDPPPFAPPASRKLAQLTREVARAVRQSLDVDVHDPGLDGCHLLDAVPDGAGGFLLLFTSSGDVASVEGRLTRVLPLLRSAVAARTARRRVPRLSAHVLPAGAVPAEPGGAVDRGDDDG